MSDHHESETVALSLRRLFLEHPVTSVLHRWMPESWRFAGSTAAASGNKSFVDVPVIGGGFGDMIEVASNAVIRISWSLP